MKIGFDSGLEVFRRGGAEQGAKAFVHLGADEVQPFLQVVAGHGAVGRRQVLFRRLVGQVLNNGWAFMQRIAAVEHQKWHIAQRVDAVEVRSVLQLMTLGAGHDGLMFEACFMQHDMGRQGASAGAVVKLHGDWLSMR